MQTTTKPRDAGTGSRTTAPRRRKLGATLLAAGALSVVGVLAAAAELTSDPPRARSTSPMVVEARNPTTPTPAPFENDSSLCALGIEGIEATYPGPLVAQTASRYYATCSPAANDAPFPAPND